ncbi:MAG: acetylglutamate kinase [Azospirillum sp.]|nr:acetylglutamate kinase [Azospirillum sp.]
MNDNQPRPFTTPPTLAELEALAETALATVPDQLRRYVRNVVILVDEFPDQETEQAMDLETPFDLLGLYRGTDLAHRSVHDLPQGPDHIYLYRRPLLDYWCETGEDLAVLVRHVLIHEIGHHFGFSDDDMERLEAEID